MAAHAFGGETEAVELADGADFVTGVAVDGGVRPDQGEAVLVLVDIVNRDLPAIGVVTEFAFRAVLAAMEIGVAVLTFHRSAGEIEVLMAVDTIYFCVAAAQREFRL